MLATLFASMVVVGLAGLATLTIGVHRGVERRPSAEAPRSPAATKLPEPQVSRTVKQVESKERPEEKAPETPIEEVLLENGEDPGAVFYTSRIREAIREGNPAFGRELLPQMKEEHSESVLIEEAEALFETARSRS